ncbi:hypothetical protein K2173_016295 [Erythroxylum novogranatense]|uniref:Reverse transcriptase zinc-binding domain-containing protein n=1 Tax=Erythroxylum novogranatense TaxID=1862640 RepID=A0AAV8SGH9_9ROSI|nr:hypothetical protein K2173_016295 [Erythroxylum novogranatense]
MVNEYGRWDWPQFRSYVDATVAMQIVAMKPPAPHNNADGYMWRWSKKGNFNIADTFGALSQASNNPADDKWNWAWKFIGPQRIRHFIWLVLKERLLTNGERQRRGFTEIDICSLCGSSRESIIHAIRDCHWARTVWLKVLPHTMVNRFFTSSMSDWMIDNLSNAFRIDYVDWDWPTCFGILCWKIWKAHNSVVFEGVSTGSEAIVVQGQGWAKQVKDSSMKPGRRAAAFPMQVYWQPPTLGWIKLNVDGAVNPLNGVAAAGGVLRSTNGSWLAGFAHNLGICSVTNAKLWGLLDGL